MKIVLLATTLLFSSFFLLSCKKDNPIPPGDQPQISLTLEDASCTEAWIKLTTANISLPADVELLKDDNPVKTISLISADTILYIDSLLPNHTYKYQSVIQSISQSSSPLIVTTMDTTSHNFTWQSWTFGGQAGSCALYDVAVINENDIWAVGEINIADTSINGYTMYNAVHWDGSNWTTKRIQTIFRGNIIVVPLTGIYTFSSTDIWMVGSLPIHGDGENWVMYDLRTTVDPNLSLAKVWGGSTDGIYFVGNNGNIARYDGRDWKKIESGTNLNINDIWGVYDVQIKEKNIIAVGGNILEGLENIILQFTDDASVEQLTNAGVNYPLSAIWFKSKMNLYVGGSGLYTKNYTKTAWRNITLPNYFIYSIRGNDLNDILVCGGAGYIGHFNGSSWINYLENGLPQITGNYYGCAIKGNIMCAVAATIEGTAVVVIGIRN